MKKVIYILILFVFGVPVIAKSQQIVLHSQYMINSFDLNPAVAGTKTYAPLVLGFRRQWMGIREAPVSQHISYHTSISENLGVGGMIFNDVAGPSRRSGLLGAVSTQIDASRFSRISFAIAGSLSQYMINRELLITEEDGDVTVEKYTSNRLIPDLGFGVKWFGDRYQVGLSGFNLIQTNVDLSNIVTPVTNNLERTFYLSGSYLIPLDENDLMYTIEPSAVFRYMINAPFQFDINLRGIYNRRLWIGASYRYLESVVGMVGFSTARFGISYSYDYSTSVLADYNFGSHELMITFRNKNTRGKSGTRRKFSSTSFDCPTF